MQPSRTIWILVDTSNSNVRSKNYLWWFETRKLARTFLRDHKKRPNASHLIGPFKYNQDPKCRYHGKIYLGPFSTPEEDLPWLHPKDRQQKQRPSRTTRSPKRKRPQRGSGKSSTTRSTG